MKGYRSLPGSISLTCSSLLISRKNIGSSIKVLFPPLARSAAALVQCSSFAIPEIYCRWIPTCKFIYVLRRMLRNMVQDRDLWIVKRDQISDGWHGFIISIFLNARYSCLGQVHRMPTRVYDRSLAARHCRVFTVSWIVSILRMWSAASGARTVDAAGVGSHTARPLGSTVTKVRSDLR